MSKTVEQKFRKLDEVDHVLLRPGRYLGSVTYHEEEAYIFDLDAKAMRSKNVSYLPAFLKIFDEVISNSVDHSKRPEGKHLDTIKVNVDSSTGAISIFDNGGIPVVKHAEYNQWVPEMIFELRAGSNFDDSDEAMLTGQNGEGAALTSIFSSKFTIETCDGKNTFVTTFTNNSRTRATPTVTPCGRNAKGFTRITYEPDYAALKMQNGMTADDYAMLLKRVVDVAGLNSHLKVFWNDSRINTRTFKEYVQMYTGDGDIIHDENEYWKVAVAHSDNGFKHVSFVNGTFTKEGGNHISYVGMQIWERIREYIKKKHKIDVKPNELRQHMMLFIDCSIVNPRYSSQTKEQLITEAKDFKTSWSVTEKMIKQIINSDIIKSVLDWAEAKAMQQEMAEARKLSKEISKNNPRGIDKFSDANERKHRHRCTIFLAEGDSAQKSIQAGRGKSPYIGSYALRGKTLNVMGESDARVMANKEIKNIMTILGLAIGEKVEMRQLPDDTWHEVKIGDKIVIANINDDVQIDGEWTPVWSLSLDKAIRPNEALITSSKMNPIIRRPFVPDLRYGRIAFCTDADVDGAHIQGLLCNLMYQYWPELFDYGVVNIFRTPLIKVKLRKGDVLSFFSERDFKEWEQADGQRQKGWTYKYIKGLGTSMTAEFTEYLNNIERHLYQIRFDDEDDSDALDLAFNSARADDRKDWLVSKAASFDDFVEEV